MTLTDADNPEHVYRSKSTDWPAHFKSATEVEVWSSDTALKDLLFRSSSFSLSLPLQIAKRKDSI